MKLNKIYLFIFILVVLSASFNYLIYSDQTLTIPGFKLESATNVGLDKYPQLAIDSKGTIWLTYVSMRNRNDAIYLKSYKNGMWSGEHKVSTIEGIEGFHIEINGYDTPWAVSVNHENGYCWASEDHLIIKISSEGDVEKSITGFNLPKAIAVNPGQ